MIEECPKCNKEDIIRPVTRGYKFKYPLERIIWGLTFGKIGHPYIEYHCECGKKYWKSLKNKDR